MILGIVFLLPYAAAVTPEVIKFPSILISVVPSKFTPAPFTLPALSPVDVTLIPIDLAFFNLTASSAVPTKVPLNFFAYTTRKLSSEAPISFPSLSVSLLALCDGRI